MTKTESANRTVQAVVIEACEQLLECQMSAGARLAIPNTGNLIMVGEPEWIAKNVPGVEAMVEASEPKLDEDDITAIWQTMPGGPAGWLKSFGFLQFARAIEAEVIDRLAATTQASTAQAEQTRAWFRRASSFGPWMECGPNDDGATLFLGERVDMQEVATSSTDAQAAAEVRDAWISVDERLPDEETDVLVRGMRGNSICHEVAGLFDGEWMGQNSEIELRFMVTHWMPLPTAPVVLRSAGDTGGVA